MESQISALCVLKIILRQSKLSKSFKISYCPQVKNIISNISSQKKICLTSTKKKISKRILARIKRHYQTIKMSKS